MKLGSYVFMKDQLQDAYLEKFNFVEHYGEIHMVSSEIMAEKMMDLMDLMIEAQERKDPVETIVGNHVEDFCKNYFSDVTILDMLKDVAKQIKLWSWLAFALELLCLISEMGDKDFRFFSYKTDISGYLMGIMIAWTGIILADIVGIVLAKFGNYSKKAWVGVAVAGTAAAVLFDVIYCMNSDGFTIPAYALILSGGLYLLIYYAVVFVYRYKTTGSLKKQKNDYETTFTGLVKAEIDGTDYSRDISIVKAFSKRYVKVNRRRAKKGKTVLTTAEYFEKAKNEGQKGMIFGFSIGFAFCLISSIVSPGSFFEGPVDALVFFLVLAVIMYPLSRLMKGIDKIAEKEKRSILAACNAKGVELDVYYEMLVDGTLDLEEK